MANKTLEKNFVAAFMELAGKFPVAKGSLTATHSPCARKNCRLCAAGKGHPKLIYTFRDNGRLRGLYVRPEHEAMLREALERGRTIERMLVECGESLVRGMRVLSCDK